MAKIKVNSSSVDIVRPFEVLCGDGMYLGTGYTVDNNTPTRIVMVRKGGMCRYVLVGRERGRVVMGVKGFHRIRMLNANEVTRIEKNIELYRRFK